MHSKFVLALALCASVACSSKSSSPPAVPTITIGAPTGQVVGSNQVAVTGSVTGPGIQAVTVALNGGAALAATVSGGSFSASVTLAEGNNAIVAAVTASGGTASATAHVSYFAPPTIAITAPQENLLISATRAVTVQGTVTGAGVSAVTLSLNGGAAAPATVTGASFSAPVTCADGNNTIVATVTAAGGTASATVHVSYSATPIVIDTPTEGQRITGPASRAVVVTGRVSGPTAQTVSVTANGGAAVSAVTAAGAFTATVNLNLDGANTIVASVPALTGAPSATVHVVYPFITLVTFQAASVAIGPTLLTTAPPAQVPAPVATAGSFRRVYGDPGWDGTNLYLPDFEDNRVLAFTGVPTAQGALAKAAGGVLGQPDFATVTSGSTLTLGNTTGTVTASASKWSGPQTVRAAGTQLLVLEQANSRVLVFNALPTTNGAAASLAIGSASLITAGGACTSSQLDLPQSFIVVGTKLIVADSGNNRVLIWNTIPTTAAKAADVVLGQTGFGTGVANNPACQPNGSAPTPSGSTTIQKAPTAATLSHPGDVWSDGTRLYVADTANNRVLGWNAIPTASGTAADFVLGQASVTASVAGTTNANLNGPTFLGSNGNQLFVADSENNRVLVWNTLPVATNTVPLAAALLPDVVLGQSGFTQAEGNDDNQDGFADAAPSARTLAGPSGITVTDDAVIVGDHDNNRYLVFKHLP